MPEIGGTESDQRARAGFTFLHIWSKNSQLLDFLVWQPCMATPQPLTYPRTRYTPTAPVDMSDKQERERLSDGAVAAFLNIMQQWAVKDDIARQLLGGISNGAFYDLKKTRSRALDEDRLRRISYLVGIFKALNVLYDPTLADRWMQMPNTNRLFGGSTPLTYLVSGGLPALMTLRRLLDARRG